MLKEKKVWMDINIKYDKAYIDNELSRAEKWKTMSVEMFSKKLVNKFNI